MPLVHQKPYSIAITDYAKPIFANVEHNLDMQELEFPAEYVNVIKIHLGKSSFGLNTSAI